ncbi:MAG: DEAD/DEAH box helicase, partial [Candidatus Nanohaloarchaea archaeon]
MEVASLSDRGVPQSAVDRFLANGIDELNPPQVDAVEAGLLDGNSLVVSSPTASGKTLIATMAISKLLEETDRKALYLVPLKALGSEKYRDYQEFFDGSVDSSESDRSSGAEGSTLQDVDVALSVGDRDSSADYVETKDLIIMTVEKLDAVLRHNP